MSSNEMSPVDWAKRPIVEKYADFSGRAPRAEYWWYTLAVVIVAIVLSIIESILGINRMVGPYGPLSALFMLAILVPGIAVGVRRLHDSDRSGWWMLLILPYFVAALLAGAAAASGSMSGLGSAGILMLIGFVGCIALLVFMVLAGTPGDNRYGPNPYGEGAAVAAE